MSVLLGYVCDVCGSVLGKDHEPAVAEALRGRPWWTLSWDRFASGVDVRELNEETGAGEFMAHACSPWCASKLLTLFTSGRKFPVGYASGGRGGSYVYLGKLRLWQSDYGISLLLKKEAALFERLRNAASRTRSTAAMKKSEARA